MCALSALGALLLAGCGSQPGAGHGAPDAGGATFGRLQLILTVPADGGMTVATVGRLVRYRNLDAESAQVLAGVSPQEPLRLGQCALVDPEAALEDALATAGADAAVQMLDAGEIMVRMAGQAVKLQPRYLPEILPFVSGVVYDTDAATTAPLEPAAHDEALVTAFGGDEVGRFDASVELPALPHVLGVERAEGGGVTVRWTPSGGQPTAIVLARDAGPMLRCQSGDSGRFTIPAEALARFGESARGDVVVAVERARRSRFAAKGLASAELLVTVRELAPLPAP